ncbi:hypothetical protein J5839_04155 [Methanosarcinaceae archaeon]|nr:hypothetical protein [Methanosarcinaceae archaeon]
MPVSAACAALTKKEAPMPHFSEKDRAFLREETARAVSLRLFSKEPSASCFERSVLTDMRR